MKYNKNENYCSYSPDRILGCTFNYGCFLHDRQYRNEVAVRKTRKEADKQLQQVIYKKLKTSKDDFEAALFKYVFFTTSNIFLILLRQKIAYPWSMMYYLGVRIFGKSAWKT